MTELLYRYPVPRQICQCLHARPEHRPDLKNEPCDQCECKGFLHRWNDYRETRVIREEAS